MTELYDGPLIALAKTVASGHELAPELVCALIERESTWRPWAMRFEPSFFQTYCLGMFTNGKIDVSEAYARAISWGLMQIMGQSAREQGFQGQFLPELCDPATGIEFGCRLLKRKIARARGDVAAGLLLWNGGGNPSYATDVLALAAKYK